MSDFERIDSSNFRVTGDLTFSSAASVWDQAKTLLPDLEEENLTIDIGSAKKFDSGGLALLIAWSRWAYCNKKKLIFSNASNKVRKLVEVNKLQELLTLA